MPENHPGRLQDSDLSTMFKGRHDMLSLLPNNTSIIGPACVVNNPSLDAERESRDAVPESLSLAVDQAGVMCLTAYGAPRLSPTEDKDA